MNPPPLRCSKAQTTEQIRHLRDATLAEQQHGTLSRQKRRREATEERCHGEVGLHSISDTLRETEFISSYHGSQHMETLILNSDVLITQTGDNVRMEGRRVAVKVAERRLIGIELEGQGWPCALQVMERLLFSL
jgi:hypothetical protein